MPFTNGYSQEHWHFKWLRDTTLFNLPLMPKLDPCKLATAAMRAVPFHALATCASHVGI